MPSKGVAQGTVANVLSARARHSSWRVRLTVSLRIAFRVVVRKAFTMISRCVGRSLLPPLIDQWRDPLGTSHLRAHGTLRLVERPTNKASKNYTEGTKPLRNHEDKYAYQANPTQPSPDRPIHGQDPNTSRADISCGVEFVASCLSFLSLNVSILFELLKPY